VVVTPFVALTADTIQRCEDHEIHCAEWTPKLHTRAPIVVVGAERAGSDEFQSYLDSLVHDNNLARIVVDECHLVISAKYRERLKDLQILQNQPVPMVLMTATMPPSREQEFEEAMLLEREADWVRSPTMRKNFAYQVLKSRHISTLAEESRKYIKRRVNALPDSERAVAYCRTKKLCRCLARKLGCDYYYAGHDGNRNAFSDWIAGVHKVIVATGALGTGVDIQGITLVSVQQLAGARVVGFVVGERRQSRVTNLFSLGRLAVNCCVAGGARRRAVHADGL